MDKFKEVLLGVVRHAATFVAGYLVSNGVIEASQTETIVGAIIALVGVGWSMWAKKAKPEA